MKKATLTLSLVGFSLLVLAILGLYLLFLNLRDLESRRAAIVAAAEAVLHREVRYEKASFSLRTGPVFTFSGVTISEREGTAVFAQAERLVCRIDAVSLLKGDLSLSDLRLVAPRLTLRRDGQGRWNWADLLAGEDSTFTVGRIAVERGVVLLEDRFPASGVVRATLTDLNLVLGGWSWGGNPPFHLKAVVVQTEGKGNIAASGALSLPRDNEKHRGMDWDLRLRVQGIDLRTFSPYTEAWEDLRLLRGLLDGTATLRGGRDSFSLSSAVAVRGMSIRCPRIFPDGFAPKQTRLECDLERQTDGLHLRRSTLACDGVRARMTGSVKDLETQDPLVAIRVSTEPATLAALKPVLPFGLLPPEVTAYIRNHIQEGTFHLAQGTLQGRVSRIAGSAGQGGGGRVLEARIHVEGGALSYGSQVPLFSGIKGVLAVDGTGLSLQGMTGRFGRSPLTLDGAVRQDPRLGVVAFPFRATIKAGDGELAWLLGEEAVRSLTPQGIFPVELTGDGPLDAYRLDGDGDLSGMAYGYGPFRKPAGQANRIRLASVIRNGDVEVSSFVYTLDTLVLQGRARADFREGRRNLSLSVRSNVAELRHWTPFLPSLASYGASGRIRLSLKGEGSLDAWKDLNWRGRLVVKEGRIRLAETIRPLEGIDGVLELTGGTVATTGLSLRLGSSALKVKGRVDSRASPVGGEATISSELLDLADAGWESPKGRVRIRDLRLAVKADPQTFQVPHASARLNASSFNVRLSMPRTPGPSPVARFQVSAPLMDVEDLALLVSLRSTDRTVGRKPSVWTLQGDLEVGTGRFSGQTASRLRTDLEYRRGRLTLSNASLQALGGSFTGDGTVDLTDEKRPRYEVTFAMSDVPAASLLRLTPLPPDKLSGPVSAKGRLEAAGADEGSLRHTLSGDVQIWVGKGVVKEFAVLSKIFSILNVSQLLRLRLPDMTVDGMPFRSIRASWRLADGIARTDDLLLRGPAMNIAAQGHLDLRRETMDMTVGVQPLQTIDKVVSRIPVLGWILTDTDRRFLTVTFEAKGPWRDPVVKAVPVRALALEVLNIFKRVLELPAKLLTDAGEVF